MDVEPLVATYVELAAIHPDGNMLQLEPLLQRLDELGGPQICARLVQRDISPVLQDVGLSCHVSKQKGGDKRIIGAPDQLLQHLDGLISLKLIDADGEGKQVSQIV